MRKIFYPASGLSPLLILTFFTAGAQGQQKCGGYLIDTIALKKAKDYEVRSAHKPLQATTNLIRVYFHILSSDDGTLTAATTGQVDTEFNTLVADYAADNICFIKAGINYINSTRLNTSFNAAPNNDPPSLFDPYRISNCLNIFYVNSILGNNPSCPAGCGFGGISFTIPGTMCLIASSNIASGQTTSHEVGHCLGLLHTFETALGTEKIDGSNASSAGDQVTDTPADPFGNTGTCFATSPNLCLYTGNCTDPNGATNYSPPYSNLMAYWWLGKGKGANCYFNLFATAGQFTRVNSYLNTNNGLKACASPADVTESNITQLTGYLMVSAINTLSTANNVSILGNANVTFGGTTVLLEPGLHAVPNSDGLFLVRPKPCQ